jgi:Leucine-rich repeat (LRR) protein
MAHFISTVGRAGICLAAAVDWIWGLGILLIAGVIAVTVLLLVIVALVKGASRLLPLWRRSCLKMPRRWGLVAGGLLLVALVVASPWLLHVLAVQIVWTCGGALQYEGGDSMVNVIATRETLRARSGETWTKRFTGPVVGLRMLPGDWRLPRWVLGQFPQLEFLTLNDVRSADFARVGGLTKLKMLVVHPAENVDSGMEELQSLPQLWSLRINESNSLSDKGAAKLVEVPKLRALWLESGQITDQGIEQLAELELTDLIVSSHRVTDAGIADLRTPPLSWLSVDGTRVTNDGLLKLRSKNEWLSTNPEIHASDPVEAELVKSLEPNWGCELDAAGRVVGASLAVSDPPSDEAFAEANVKALARLKNLERIMLWGESIDDAALERMAPLRNVKRLQLQGTKISAKGFTLLQSWPELREVSVYGGDEGVLPVAALADVERLESLALEEVPLSPADVDQLAGLKSLRQLKLRFCEVGTDHIERLGKLPALEELDLTGNDLKEQHITPLGKLQQLKMLIVLANDLSEEDVRQLEQALPSCRVYSNFSEDLPESLKE